VIWLGRFGVPQGAISSFEENELTGADLIELSEEELSDDLELDAVVSKLIWPQIEKLKACASQPLDPGSYSPVATPLPAAAPSPVTWDNEQVLAWLRDIDCEAAIETFQQNALTGEDIFDLSQEEVETELDIPDPDVAKRVWKQLHFLRLKNTPIIPGYDY
jgi:SAM domain (Sterile alpha motif)